MRKGEKRSTRRKNLSEQTQLTLWHRRRDLNQGHISGRRALSLLCHPLLRVQTDGNLVANKRLNQPTRNIFLFCDRRSVAQQCWIRLQTSSNINCWGHARGFHMVKDLNFCFRPFNVGYILNLISNRKPSVSCGLDNISSRLLKLCSPYISDSICDIINHVLETGIFPDDWKKAKVHPIFKSDERNIPSNYRPISILPSISKIIERAMHSQL